MAERIVSPGVFTQENDLSFLPVGIGEIGAAIIGNTQKGVAFEPQVIRSFNEFQDQFGAGTDGTYVPYTVKEYIRHAGAVTIVRTLGLAGYSNSNSALVYTFLSGSGAEVTQSAFIGAVLHPTARDEDATFAADESIGALDTGNKDFINGVASHSFTNTEATTNLTFSFDEDNADYILNCLGQSSGRYVPATALDSATTPVQPVYVYALFNSESVAQHIDETAFSNLTGTGGTIQTTTLSASRADLDFNGGTNSPIGAAGYSHACTPYVRSQTINGSTFRLFKVHTLGHGNAVNDDFKISISNVKKAGSVKGDDYGSFTLQVRKYDDTDTRPISIETYANLSIDPDNPNFIGRRVGTQYRSYDSSGKLIVNGMFPNISKYIRIEIDEAVMNKVVSPKLVPFGHDAYQSPFSMTVDTNNGAADSVTAGYPPAVMVVSKSHDDSKTFFGFEFNSDNAKGNYNYVAPLSDTAAAVHNKALSLDTMAQSGSGFVTLDSPLKYKKFSLAFQGGFDGVNPALRVSVGVDLSGNNSFGHDVSSATATGYTVYNKAINAIANPDEIDVNLIVTPGILNSNSTAVIARAIEVCEDRGDAFYIFDPNNSLQGDSIASATSQADSYDTNYAAMYYPWVKILDSATNRFKFVPPSVVIPGVYAFNDKVAHPWFAPAGLNRGSLTTVLDVYTRLTHAERDELYEGRINPIAVFPRTGVCVWGQKTLQAKPSALDRINVRRLLIAAKKFIASATKFLVFENNTTATRQRFLNIVNPYLESVQQNQGLYAFRVIMDETNNTPDIIDRNIMKGEIFLQPAKAAEFIIIDFNIMPTGASFDE